MKPIVAATAGIAGLATLAVLTLPNLVKDGGAEEAAERYTQAMLDRDYTVVCDMWDDELRASFLGERNCADYVSTMEANDEQTKASASQSWGADYETVMADYHAEQEVVYAEDHSDHTVVGMRVSESYDGDLEAMKQYFGEEGEPRVSLLEMKLEEHDGDWQVTALSNESSAA